MSKAVNVQLLHEGGYKYQALKMAESESASVLQDWENESTIYTFADGSVLESSGGDMTVVSSIEGIEIKSASTQNGQLTIECEVTLNDGQVIDYTSCNDLENLEFLSSIGGAQSSELRDALGEDYLDDVAHHLIKAVTEKWDSLDALLADCQGAKLTKLQAAISATDTSGFPGAWTVDQREDGDVLLVWTATLKNVPDMDGDEPWVKGGGDAIMRAAGIGGDYGNSAGSDSYQDKHGDDVVTQWVCFKK